MKNELQAIEKLLEDNDYDCIVDPVEKDAVFCFSASKWFYTLQDALDWLNEEE